MKTFLSYPSRKRRGSAALIAIVTMIIMVILGLAGATLALNARLMSSHRTRDAGIRSVTEAGVQFGYWQFVWNRVALPYYDTNHTFGEGSFTVQVTDNSGVVADTIKVTATGTLRGATYTSTRVFRSDQQIETFSINPASTFLLFNKYGAVDAQRIDLGALDIDAKDTIRLTVHGHWGPSSNPYYSSATDLIFSKNSILLPPSAFLRVPGAILSTAPSYFSVLKDGLLSDIPEDFVVTTTMDIVVPTGSKYLLVGTDFTDAVNISADNYSLEVKKLTEGGP